MPARPQTLKAMVKLAIQNHAQPAVARQTLCHDAEAALHRHLAVARRRDRRYYCTTTFTFAL